MIADLTALLFFIFLLAWGATWGLREISLRYSLLDVPNRRSSHSIPVPRTGGLAILLGFYLGAGYLSLTGRAQVPHLLELGWCGLGIAIVGFLDDLFHLSVLMRLIVHLFCVFIAIHFFIPLDALFPGLDSVLAAAAAEFILVFGAAWLVNLYNFMDGIDGLAGMETVSAALGAGIILVFIGGGAGYVPLLLVLAVSALGFLAWNRPPARIFMGDAGSSFLGFCFGIFALLTAACTGLNLWAWGILLGAFVVDATVTLAVRIALGRKFYRAHRSHAYQILARRTGSHLRVTTWYAGINWLLLFPLAALSVSRPEYGPGLMIFSYALLAILCIFVGAGRTND